MLCGDYRVLFIQRKNGPNVAGCFANTNLSRSQHFRSLLSVHLGIPLLLVDGEGYCQMTASGSLPRDAEAYSFN